MKVHHLDCGTIRPRLVHLGLEPLVCHCLLIETDGQGLVLVDTGFGTLDCESPCRRLGAPMTLLIGRPDVSRAAYRQIQRLGLRQVDVRHTGPAGEAYTCVKPSREGGSAW